MAADPSATAPAAKSDAASKAAAASAPAGGTAIPIKPAIPPKAPPPKPEKKVDINNASLDELKTQLKLGDAEARKIVENRPYKSKGELVTKAGLPEGVYYAVKRRIELQKPRKAATK